MIFGCLFWGVVAGGGGLKITFFENSFRTSLRVVNSLDADQDQPNALILVKTVCKSYQQTSLVGKE